MHAPVAEFALVLRHALQAAHFKGQVAGAARDAAHGLALAASLREPETPP